MQTFDKRLLRQAWQAQTALLLTVLLGLLTGIVLVGQAFYLSRVISRVFIQGYGLAGVQPWLLALLALSLVRAALSWGSQVSAQQVAGRVKKQLRRHLAAHLLTLGPAYTQGERSGELTNTAGAGIEALDTYFSQYLPQVAMAALVPLAILAFVFPLDFTSGLVLLLTAPLIPLFMWLIGQAAQEKTRQQWLSLSRMSAHFLDVLQGLTTLKLFGRSRDQLQAIVRISHRFRRTTMSVLQVAFLSALVLEWVATISTAIVAVEVGLRLLYGHLQFEQALFVLILAPEFYQPLRLLGSRFHAGMPGAAAARRICALLETPPPTAAPKINTLPPLQFAIRFDGVHYAYPADAPARPALNGLTLAIEPGQKVALIGPSGSGKSTVAALLLRFIDPQQGTITVDGLPLPPLDPTAWRQQVAWVPQQPYLFHATVADNIRLARPQATTDQVHRAARQANAHAFIQQLPQGYDTLIGERGQRLSGGQAQRLALARAFLKDAPLLILDEAPAHLDPGHESQVQAALARLLQPRTALIIAHRLNTIYTADHILVMAGGIIREQGTHTALLSQGGLYHQLVTAYRGGGA